MILITGTARSGTSLTAGIFAACGASLGGTNNLNENLAIRDGMVKPYIKSLGADPLCQHPLPTPAMVTPAPDWRARVLANISGPRPAYKGAKMCHIWPLWHDAFPDARWIIVRRERERIIDSCIRTSFMRAHGDSREGWGAWHDAHLPRFVEIMHRCDAIEIWPDREMREPEPFRAAVEFAGLTYDAAAVRATIRPGLWHR